MMSCLENEKKETKEKLKKHPNKNVYNFLYIFSLVIFVGLAGLSSCSNDDPDPVVEEPAKVTLVEATSILKRTASELKIYLANSNLQIDPEMIKYDVELFRVEYKTKYKDSEVVASGIVVLPTTEDSIGMISFQHGTLVAHNSAPTALPANSNELVLYAALSSVGFIAVIPDYLGFGESTNLFHPYYIETATAAAVIDNIYAAKEFAAQKELNFNDKLFLAGYSQGGYATMAAHKAFEMQGITDFNLIASFPAAGGYDVKGMQEYFFQQEVYDNPYYIAYVALSYKSYYGWDEDMLGDFFNEPFASRIPLLFNGINSGDEINAQLDTHIATLIDSTLLAEIDSSPEYQFLVNAFEENSLLDWKPTKTMIMYHGDADVTVPYENSVNTYHQFINQGVSTSTVTLITLPNGTHNSGIVPYIEDFMEKLFTMK